MTPECVVVSGVDVTNDAVESDSFCPRCGGTLFSYPWWDDSPKRGGAVVGTFVVCGDCGYRGF